MDLNAEINAYGGYVNGLTRARLELEPAEFELYLEDLAKARAALEVAWLETVEVVGRTTSDGVW